MPRFFISILLFIISKVARRRKITKLPKIIIRFYF